MNSYKFLEAGRWSQSIFKEWFCDQWIEEHKQLIQSGDEKTLQEGIYILQQMLTILEPFCPFICDTIYENFFNPY